MKKTKLTLIPLLLASLVLILGACSSKTSSADKKDTLSQIKESGKLVIGTSPDFPPSEFYILDENQKKQIVGSDISIAQAIADKIGVDLEIKATDFNGVLANIQAGKVDLGISGFAQTEERKKVMKFSDGYQQDVSDDYQGILVTKEIAEKYKTLDDLKAAKLTIGAQGGSIQYEIAGKLTDSSKVKQYGTMDAAFLALSSGDLEGVTVSTSSAKPILATFPNLVLLPKDHFDLDPENMYGTNVIGFPMTENNDSLIKLVNDVIKESRENGDLEKWKNDAEEQAKNAIDEN